MEVSENKKKMANGELYFAFTPELEAERSNCKRILRRYNEAVTSGGSRRQTVSIWRELVGDLTPMPPAKTTPQDDDAQFEDDPIVESPVFMDYGSNVQLGANVFVNAYSTWIDTCSIVVGARTLLGPHVSLYSGTHPLDPATRNGTRGPEMGAKICIGEDCWIGGNVTILPGITIGRGSTIGAGSVVTKDVPPFHVVAGNPARILRKISSSIESQIRSNKN